MTDIFKLLRGDPQDSDYKKKGVIVQGITGAYGSLHAKNMMTYGTNIVAGVTPGKGGQKFEGKVPIFNTVKDAVDATGAKNKLDALIKAFTEVTNEAGPRKHLAAEVLKPLKEMDINLVTKINAINS